jgi:hypothetical protein
MKVEGPRGPAPTGSARRAGANAAPGFAPSVDAAQRVPQASSVGGVTALDAVLALQMDEPPAQRRARQLKRGHDALNALDELEQGLLLGRAPGRLSVDLARLQAQSQMTGDAGLDAVLREIDTRLAVEAAKLEMSR